MSSAIRHIHYQPDREELSIWFGPEGRRYKYFGVPGPIYEALRDAPSRTGFFNHAIRDHYPCELATPSDHRNRRWRALHPAFRPTSATIPKL